MTKTIKELETLVGGLSTPTKMPGFAYGIPAARCIMGGILRTRPGSVCSKCYAHKGYYAFPAVQAAQENRLAILLADLPAWQANMIELLRLKYRNKGKRDRYFRWHDSGDLQSPEHLSAIVAIAEALPDIRFWLPSKEWKIIGTFKGKIPANLTIRLSMPNIGQSSEGQKARAGIAFSTVNSGMGEACESKKRGGKCGPCRACWDPTVRSVDYAKH